MDRSTKRRRWEEMDQDCLACIFIKVGIESLLLFVPLVCKSWYHATRNPVCYERLTFPDSTADDGVDPWSVDEKLTRRLPKYFNSENARFDFFIRKFAREFRIEWTDFTILKFMKLVVGRSGGSVKFLKLPGLASHYMNAIHGILELISSDCKKFTGFQVTDGNIGKSAVEAVVKFCPNLKHLSLRKSTIVKSNLVTILEGCRNLEVLDVRNCEGFEANDEEILKLAAHIPKFMCRGSKLFARKNSRLRVVVIGSE